MQNVPSYNILQEFIRRTQTNVFGNLQISFTVEVYCAYHHLYVVFAFHLLNTTNTTK